MNRPCFRVKDDMILKKMFISQTVSQANRIPAHTLDPVLRRGYSKYYTQCRGNVIMHAILRRFSL